MYSLVSSVLIFLSILCGTLGEICSNPKVKSNSYTSVDGMVISDVAFVSEFTVTCDDAKNFVLLANKNGKQVSAVRSLDYSNYQISWTDKVENLYSGEHGVKVYDEESYAAVRKAQRNNEDASKLPSAFYLSVYHKGTYYGPWVSSEFVASAVSLLLWYIAYSTKANLML